MRRVQPLRSATYRVAEYLYVPGVVQLTYQPRERGALGGVEHVHHETMDAPRNDSLTMRAAVRALVER